MFYGLLAGPGVAPGGVELREVEAAVVVPRPDICMYIYIYIYM